MTKVVSEDALKARLQGDRRDGRRGLACAIISPFACSRCLPNPGSSIVDATTKPLYGYREGAVLGDNPKKPAEETRRRNPPKKPGRPSHCYLTCSMASRRLVLDVDVGPGDAPAPKQKRTKPVGVPRPPSARPLPALLRGDCGFGAEGVMRAAEARRLAYLFKLRLTKNARRMIEKLSGREWIAAGQGFWARKRARFAWKAGAGAISRKGFWDERSHPIQSCSFWSPRRRASISPRRIRSSKRSHAHALARAAQ